MLGMYIKGVIWVFSRRKTQGIQTIGISEDEYATANMPQSEIDDTILVVKVAYIIVTPDRALGARSS